MYMAFFSRATLSRRDLNQMACARQTDRKILRPLRKKVTDATV
jgi:hypothetical protein